MQPAPQPILDADEGLTPAGLGPGADDQREALEGAVELDRVPRDGACGPVLPGGATLGLA